jgi:hypothetical protein
MPARWIACLVVTTRDGASYVVDTATPGRITATTAAATGRLSVSTRGLAMFQSSSLALTLLDIEDGEHWPVLLGVRRILHPTLSQDGTKILGLDALGTLLAWSIDVPDGSEATRAWLDRLTNATTELGPTTVTWQ